MRAIRLIDGVAACDDHYRDPTLAPGEAFVRPLRLGLCHADLTRARHAAFAGVLGCELVGQIEHIDSPASERNEHALTIGFRVVATPVIPCGGCDLCKRGLPTHCRDAQILGCVGRDGVLSETVALPLTALVPVPDGVDDDAAVFASLVATALHAARRVRIEDRPFITILGDGPEALATAQVMAKRNATVRLLGTEPARFGLCEKWGIPHRHEGEVGLRHDQDIVVIASNAPDAMILAVGMAQPRGRIVLMQRPTRELSRAVLNEIVERELTLIGVRGGDIRAALALIAQGQIDVLSLIGRKMRLAEVPQALANPQLASGLRGLVRV